MAKTYDSEAMKAWQTAKETASNDVNMFGAASAAIAAASAVLDEKSRAAVIKATPKYGYGPSGSLTGVSGSSLGGIVNSFPIAKPQRFSYKQRINKYEFEQLPLEIKQEMMQKVAHALAQELAEKYMGMVETTDGDIEIGIDIEVRG